MTRAKTNLNLYIRRDYKERGGRSPFFKFEFGDATIYYLFYWVKMYNKTINLLAIIICLFVPSHSTAGIFISKIADLQYSNISLIYANGEKNEDALWKLINKNVQLLKVEISSQTDLIKIAQKRNTIPYIKISTCPLNSGMELKKEPYIYFKGHIVNGDEWEVPYNPTPPYIYDVYFYWKSPEWKSIEYDQPPHKAYDLAANPQDICVQLVGGTMWGLGGMETNIIVVPKEAVRAALQRASK